MGRKSREHRENREKRAAALELSRIHELEEELRHLTDGDAVFWSASHCPPEIHRAGLEDVLAFESVESGVSLFEGLQDHGIDLPRPETLDAPQSVEKIRQILVALAELQVYLIGFEHMSPRQFYWTLWNETLWEGCYVQKRFPGSSTIMDVSHSIPRSEILKHLDALTQSSSVQ